MGTGSRDRAQKEKHFWSKPEAEKLRGGEGDKAILGKA